jgi:hypothetical protein
MKTKKFNYYKVIQGDYGHGWSDEDFYSVNSKGLFPTNKDRLRFKENLKAYRGNGGGVYRVIFRKEFAQ